jgi:hypothetical protein
METKIMEAWECCIAKVDRRITLSGQTVKVKKGATIFHTVYLSRGMDDDSNCEASIIQFPNGKIMGGQMAQANFEITLKKEFDQMNYSSCQNPLPPKQTRAFNISIVESLVEPFHGNLIRWPSLR